MEYQETINTWKEYPHVLTMLTRDNYNVPQGKTFMQKFLEGASWYIHILDLLFASLERVRAHVLRESYVCYGACRAARSTRERQVV